MTMRNGDGAPRELGWKGSFVLGCGIGVVVLILVGVVVYLRGKKLEAGRRDATIMALDLVRTTVRALAAPGSDGSLGDWTGQRALGRSSPIEDGWGNPIHYRCPGPVHRKGWDLWSCGPNGKDDLGTFDDVLVGEDVGAVGSR